MSFDRSLRAAGKAMSAFVRSVRQTYHAERFAFSHDLYLRVGGTTVQLASLLFDNIQGMQLSIDDARRLVKSVDRACESHDVDEIFVDDLRWKVDARDKDNPNLIVIEFDGPLGFRHALVNREQAKIAVSKFVEKFGWN